MSKQEVRDLMTADYSKYCADLYTQYPLQLQNRTHYEAFASNAQLGSMKRDVRLKSGTIAKGRVVLYVADRSEGFVTVWYQGAMCACSVKRSAIKPM